MFSSGPPASSGPVLTFCGPDQRGTIYVMHPNGQRTPAFTVQNSGDRKSQIQVSRILPNGNLQPFGSAKQSFMSGSITLSINGREVKLSQETDGMSPVKRFPGPMGQLTWKAGGWGNILELSDESELKLAQYKSASESQLEIFVQADPFFIDTLVVSAAAFEQEFKTDSKIGGKVMKAFAGLG